MFDLEVPGPPQGKGRLRHRVVRSRANPMGYASGYTPAKTIRYEEQIGALARLQWRQAPVEGPVFLCVVAYLLIPQSFSRAKRQSAISGDLRPVKKPDWDNFGKVCSDALNKIIFKDDSQVADAVVRKFYSETPRLHITILPISGCSNHAIINCVTNLPGHSAAA